MDGKLPILAAVTLLFSASCSRGTGPDGKHFPLEGTIDARIVTIGPDDIATAGFLPLPPEGLHLRLVSRVEYGAGCYRFWTALDLGPHTLKVAVRSVYRPNGPCTGEIAPAQSSVHLGNPGDGVYSIHLADPQSTYVGLLEVQGEDVRVTFPDTTRFCFSNSGYR
jgi:hypothetical protein